MKILNYYLSVFFLLFLAFSCSQEDEPTIKKQKTETLQKDKEDLIKQDSSNDENSGNKNNEENNGHLNNENDEKGNQQLTTKESVYRLIFNSSGGEGELKYMEVKEGEEVVLPYPEKYFTKLNYETTGYTDAPNSYMKYVGGSNFKMPDHDVTLYVSWHITDISLLNKPSEYYRNQAVFAEGIKEPSASEWVRLKSVEDKTVEWNKNQKWYDANQFNDPLCWAATTANVLHWWIDRNKKYIEKYYQLKGTTLEKSGLPHLYQDTNHSEIYKYLKSHWAYDGNRVQPAFNWFLSDPSFDLGGGGFFKDVFKDKNIAQGISSVKKYKFTKFCSEALHRGDVLFVAITIIGGGHAVTVWGADFDAEGYISALYYTNSNDTTSSYTINGNYSGLMKMDIVYVGDKVYTTGSTGEPSIPITDVASFSTGANYWKEYLAKHQ
ncbi:hypothetical protein EDL98_04800 [Ornithobacterium rhinotracheale]|uniref:IdeS/Mac family cysteine endopeptidase n=1 Tax=Ornithobacterium rhinotracheale TaxID=28251 RepID=UPI00129C200A|nr:IdeS/Mac family cysteine endopeptidase [Ornithobacterium rhinotracheale]MRJ07975.1 hypothetical protein [Ornithobacterium rhinotracheale]MRJ10398.1 hypothetical protein [Ornithobacterium rhinotracheale]UOH78515.1 IdeS/Mac family cysteine endopeptidase [Ornithobacterium rhinotracheale]